MPTNEKMVHKYDIFYVDLGTIRNGSIQNGLRPCLVVGNDIGNKFAPIVLVVPITTRQKKPLPTHLDINKGDGGLLYDSTILFEQIITISKNQIVSKVGSLINMADRINKKLLISLGIDNI